MLFDVPGHYPSACGVAPHDPSPDTNPSDAGPEPTSRFTR